MAPSITTPAVTYFQSATSSFRAIATIVVLRRLLPLRSIRSSNQRMSASLELLLGRRFQQGVSGARCLRGDAVAPVVALQAQRQAGRELSTLAPLRALRARTPEPAWARRAVDEGVRSCPRARCRKS